MFKWIINLFGGIARLFRSIIQAVFVPALKVFIAEFWNVACRVVEELAKTDMSNEDKRKEAFGRIEKEVKAKYIQYKTNWINILIELAWAYIKRKYNL